MTVILGINLSNKIYVAGDSRLSYEKDGNIYTRHDNIQKVENLRGCPDISVACAGDAKFARFLHDKMAKKPFAGSTIAELRNNIAEWLKPVVDEYFTASGYTQVTFLFAGADKTSKKVIAGQQFIDLANAYTGGRGPVGVNKALRDIIKPGEKLQKKDYTLQISDTKLFSVQISRNGIEITDTKWGEFLIYGPEGLVKDDIGLKEIGTFEFDPSIVNNGSGASNDIAMTNAFIYTMSEKYGLSSVGGSVLTLVNDHEGMTTFVTGETFSIPISELEGLKPGEKAQPKKLNAILVQGNSIYREENGTRYKLIPVSQYKPPTPDKMLL